jgi:exonuclease III
MSQNNLINIIKLLQYNLHLFNGLWIPTKLAGVEFHDRERSYEAINIFNKSELDFIMLQEIWSEKVANRFIKKCEDKYPYHYYDGNKKYGIMGSGLLFLSKHEILKSEFVKFNDYAGLDGMAYKGFAITKVNIYNQSIVIVNLHTQSDTATRFYGNIRMENIKQILEYLSKNYEDYPTIIAGDFNIEAESETGSCDHQEEYKEFMILMEKKGYNDSFTKENECMESFYTWCKDNSMVKYFGNSVVNKRIDFCFYNNKFDTPFSATNPGKNYWAFESDYKFNADGVVHDLSDHYPLVTKIKLSSQ